MEENNKGKILIFAGVVGILGLFWLFSGKNEFRGFVGTPGYFEGGQAEEAPEAAKEPNQEEESVYIHIVGEVKKPGVYTFRQRPRVIDVIQAAGGFTKDAVTSVVNQAETLEDGVQLVIESKKDYKKKSVGAGKQAGSGKLDLNTATKEELMTLPGIGDSKAAAILSYRETNGKFRAIEDIMKIPGIKNGVFDKIREKIRV